MPTTMSAEESRAGRGAGPARAAARPRRERWRAAAAAYALWRRAAGWLGLARGFDFQVHQVIALPPWRLRVPEPLPRGIEVRELEPGDLAALEGLRPAAGTGYAARWEQAHRAWGAWLGGRLVAFVWLRRGPVRLPSSLGCVWQVSGAMAWVYDLYSDRAVLGAIPHLYAHLRRHPPGEALQCLVGQTAGENRRSRLAHRSLGFEVRATLWSLRVGGWGAHLSHAAAAAGRGRRRWRWHRGKALIPLHLFALGWERRVAPPPAPAASDAGVRLQCVCGGAAAVGGDAGGDAGNETGNEAGNDTGNEARCACGRVLAERRGGLWQVGRPLPYWGEIPEPEMERVLARAQAAGWRAAVAELLPARLAAYVGDVGRAAFHELLPIAPGARVLDVGAGWGAIAAPLARRYRVTALEGVPARARFIALRRRQDGLAHLDVVCGDVHQTALGPGQFDAIIANGVLEWVALADLGAGPRAVQLDFLHRLRELLAPGGVIYLGIESRVSANLLRGECDHSGLPFTSLLPRPLAHLVCRHAPGYRSATNVGYRTYTYTHRGYARLFAEVGLGIESSWLCPSGYNRPEKLIPFHTPAVRFAVGRGVARGAKRWAREGLARGWVCRWLGATFAFALRAVGAEAEETAVRADA